MCVSACVCVSLSKRVGANSRGVCLRGGGWL